MRRWMSWRCRSGASLRHRRRWNWAGGFCSLVLLSPTGLGHKRDGEGEDGREERMQAQ
ncbi:MAG: hypothetical protein U0232_17580 [Thermomicrobiales bacterium]